MVKNKIRQIRADELLVRRNQAESPAAAAILIMAGEVRRNADHVITKPSQLLPEDTELIVNTPCPYVSRGAFKLEPALEKFLPDLHDLVGLDVGASTGGFTDLMLQRGAIRVYAIDSGRGQLHERLRRDPRVICHEQTNARLLSADFLPEKVDLVTMDVSFISATALMPAAAMFLRGGGWAFILVKPQFEAERRQVEAGGVVRDQTVIQECIAKVVRAGLELGWSHLDSIASPITGPKGNQEYIAIFRSKN